MTEQVPRRITIIDADVAIPITSALAELVLSGEDEGADVTTVQRSVTVPMPVEDAERCWNDFVTQHQQAGRKPGAGEDARKRGTAYFTETGNRCTEVTMQIDSHTEDASRIDAYLERFKTFVESR